MKEPIETLTGLESIRVRVERYVRADESGSVPDQLLQAAMCHPLAELACGTASSLAVSMNGFSASVSDNGPGWPVHQMQNGQRYAENLLCNLYACRDYKEHRDLADSLCRITLPVVVALSEVFTLDIHRESEHWQQTYRHGVPEGPLSLTEPTEKSGTTLAFTLDARFCGGATLSVPAFSAWLATLRESIPTEAVSIIHDERT